MRSVPWPSTRPLKIYATDPTKGYEAALKVTIPVEYEPLAPGPIGERLEVVDYDGYAKTYYDAVDLDDPAILMQGGLDPSEADPRFHQQMVYAVASRTLANFDRALGRRLTLSKSKRRPRLKLFPHGFRGRNAFYDADIHAVLFGYFDAVTAADLDDDGKPVDLGQTLPGQRVFTCLSHDIIAHEMTHAIVHRLRPCYLEPTNVDVQAFHEGFSDIVALFQHFSFPNLVSREIQRLRGDIQQPTVLVELARQFGFGTGKGKSLRSALDDPTATLLGSTNEPHDRGAILVAAVFDGFFQTFRMRIRDLVKIASGGSGELPPGDLQSNLAERIAIEASRTAQRQLDMCIRAFDYLPPVDITFGDYLRALVTADFELNPDDEWGQRSALIEGFRKRSIYPEGVISLSEEALRWPAADLPDLKDDLEGLLPQLLKIEADRFSKRSSDAELARRETERASKQGEVSGDEPAEGGDDDEDDQEANKVRGALVWALKAYAEKHRERLCLRADIPIQVKGFHAVFMTAANGRLLIELVAQLLQTDPNGEFDAILGGIKVRGGTTLVIGVNGDIRYAVAKPLPSKDLPPEVRKEAEDRIKRQKDLVSEFDARDPRFPYMTEAQVKQRMKARMSIRSLHGGE